MANSNNYPNGASKIEDYGATEPAFGNFSGSDIPGATAPAGSDDFSNFTPTAPSGQGIRDYGDSGPMMFPGGQIPEYPTVPASNSGFDSYEPTTPSGVFDNIDVTTPATPNGVHGFQPVAGWLVCIDGPEKGRDYRIHPENNYIGRLESNDICIRGDDKISREHHVMVVYDSEDRMFYLGAPAGTNIVRLNGKPVLEAKELHAYDIITIGSTKLMFAPFCGERFGWNE